MTTGRERGIKAGSAFVELLLRDRQFQNGLKKAQKRLQAFGQGIKSLGQGIGNLGKRMTALGGIGVGLFAASIKSAADAEESLSRFEQVFGDQAEAAGKFADQIAKEVGRSSIAIKDSLSAFQGFFVGLGLDPGEARKLSQQMQALALDFASFNNLSDAEAQDRFISALSGSSEVLDKFGVNIKSAALEQKLLEQGIEKTTAEASEMEKVMARIAVISESLGDQGAMGDAVRTADSLTNQSKRVAAAFQEVRVAIGTSLLPVVTPLVERLGEVIQHAREWVSRNQPLIRSIFKVAAATLGVGLALTAIGPAISAFGTAVSVAAGVAGSALTLLASGPIGLVIGAIGLAVAAFTDWEAAGKTAADAIGAAFESVQKTASRAIGGVKDAIEAGDLQQAFKVVIAAINVEWTKLVANLKFELQKFAAAIKPFVLAAQGQIDFERLGELIRGGSITDPQEGVLDELKKLRDEQIRGAELDLQFELDRSAELKRQADLDRLQKIVNEQTAIDIQSIIDGQIGVSLSSMPGTDAVAMPALEQAAKDMADRQSDLMEQNNELFEREDRRLKRIEENTRNAAQIVAERT